MKTNRSIIHYSLLAALVVMTPFCSEAALRVGNYSRGYNSNYQQNMQNVINAAPAPVITTPSTDTENNLPVKVADEELAKEIASGATDTPVAFNQLEQCSMIYPNGEFAWDNPTLGAGAGGADTCVAVVELRGYQAGLDGSDLVLARATLAAGDSMKCNIESFPEATMVVSAVENFTFPADAAPTMDDVIKQMNQEQKKNAGLKIAAAAIIGGIGGNMAGSNDPGNDSLLGTSDSKIKSTVIGALGGGAIGAGNAYAGKVAGDVILSASVNAAAGGLVGNMAGVGNSVLRIEKCTLPEGKETTCLWGALATTKTLDSGKTAFYNIDTDEIYVCDSNFSNCETENLVSIKLDAYPDSDIEQVTAEQFEAISSNPANQYYYLNNNGVISMVPATGGVEGVDGSKGIFAKIKEAATIERQIPAMIEMRDKTFGMTQSDWREWKRANSGGQTIYGRSTSGTAYVLPETTIADIQNFYPMMVNAEDGSLIDFGNKARLKSTLIGAGVGGALGGLAGYQGAQLDVQNRWVAAVREYEDSLTKVYCATGNRYLSEYNDTVFIPKMTIASE